MSVEVTFSYSCDAQCGKSETTHRTILRKGESLSRVAEAVGPEDWIIYDAIGCTYCPECWKAIWKPTDPQQEAGGA